MLYEVITNQDICIRAGNLFNLVKHIIDFIALTDNVLMVVFQFDFFLKIASSSLFSSSSAFISDAYPSIQSRSPVNFAS